MTTKQETPAADQTAASTQQTTATTGSESAAPAGSTQAKVQQAELDLNAILAKINETVTATVNSAVAPLQKKIQEREELERTGLTPEQLAEVSKFKAAGFNDEDASNYARLKNPELFGLKGTSGTFDPQSHGDLPPGGYSPFRQQVKEVNYESEMHKTKADPTKSLHDLSEVSRMSLKQKLTRGM